PVSRTRAGQDLCGNGGNREEQDQPPGAGSVLGQGAACAPVAVVRGQECAIMGSASGSGAAWSARVPWEHEVGGSNPLSPTISLARGAVVRYNGPCRAGVAQLPRAPAFQAGGRGLESRRPLHDCARSSVGQSSCLLSSGSWVRILPGAPAQATRGGCSSAGESARLWPRRSWVQVPSLTPPLTQVPGTRRPGDSSRFLHSIAWRRLGNAGQRGNCRWRGPAPSSLG